MVKCGFLMLGRSSRGLLGGDLKDFLFFVRSNCFAARLRRDRLQLPILTCFFFRPLGTHFFYSCKKSCAKIRRIKGDVLIGEITITKRSHRPVKRFVGTLLYRCKKRFNQAFSSGRRGTTKWWMRCYLLVLRSLWSKPRCLKISSATALKLFRILSLEYRKTVQAWI